MKPQPTPEMEGHPLSEMFPMLQGDEMRALANDIRGNGLMEAIITFEGKILDGRNRYHCCLTENVEPVVVEFEGDEDDARDFVISKNLHRRHLTTAQRTEIAKLILARTPEMSDREIAEKIKLDHKTVAEVRGEIGAPTAAEAIEAKIEKVIEAEPEKSDRAIAKDVGVSHHTVAKVRGGQNGEIPQNAHPGRRVLGRKAGPAKTLKATKASTKPKPISSARDEWVNSMAAQFNSDISRAIEALVMAVSGYDGVIQSKLSLSARQEFVRKFAKAMGVSLDNFRAA
jgi:hypothetical protein